MGNKKKAEILASKPEDLSPSDLKKYNNWNEANANARLEASKEQGNHDAPQGSGPAGAGKKIKDATLGIARTEPLELSPEDEEKILLKQAEDDRQRKINEDNASHYDNGHNVWKLIYRTYNRTLQTEKLLLAMKVGKIGVLVMVSDKQDTKVAIATEYLPTSNLLQIQVKGEKHWVIQ